MEIMNSNFTENEIKDIINQLKNNKSAGIDSIPAEFVKCCSDAMAADMADMFNHALEKREFPDIWAEGVRTPVYKSGMKLDTNNYRGITVLPVYEKVFELAVQRRLEFVNGAFEKADRHNGGFASGNRTSDNIFILHGLIQRQLSLGQPLIVIFVDFTKAFDLVNRNILFYKLMENGFFGRVLDILRNIYSKTHFRVKHKGEMSSPIKENVGVNQGGNCSPMFFRKYLADLSDYKSTHTGICVNEEIMIHRLWADDLFTVASSVLNAQKQMDGLLSFCKSNQTIVNELTTKVMVFGNLKEELHIKFNDTPIEHVDRYKCLGNVFNTIHAPGGDVFKQNYEYLCDRARGAIFSLLKRIRNVTPLLPQCMFYLLHSLVEPILLYGSDVWGLSTCAGNKLDSVMLSFIRNVLHVKSTTSNVISVGETGQILPSTKSNMNVFAYFVRLRHLPKSMCVKNVFDELERLHQHGFSNWYSKAVELSRRYGINLYEISHNEAKLTIKTKVTNYFKQNWLEQLHNGDDNTVLRTYRLFKERHIMEPYLYLVKEAKYRVAISRLRASSHPLEIERGRYTRPKTPVTERLCPCCNAIEDEHHFLLNCRIYDQDRDIMFFKISTKYENICEIESRNRFKFLLTNDDPLVLNALGKIIYTAFQRREIWVN